MIDAGADTDKQWQSSQGLSEQTFTEHTLLANASDDCHDNAKRAQILGFTAAEVKIAPGAIVRIGENQIGENSFVGLYSYVNGDVHIGKSRADFHEEGAVIIKGKNFVPVAALSHETADDHFIKSNR